MKRAFIYTGQGFQHPGMLHELPDHPAAKEYLGRAEEILGCRAEELDSKTALKSNENTQICIYLSEVIWSRIISEKLSCDLVSGHSAGSFAAAVEAGVMDFEQGLELIRLRGKCMESMFPSGYGMYAVTGLTESLLIRIIDEFKKTNPDALVFPATVNEKLQCAVSGSTQWLERLNRFIHKDYPAKVIPLNVTVPSHCCLMDPVIPVLEQACKTAEWKKPRIPVVVNSTARRVWDQKPVVRDLIEGAARVVRWYDGITLMSELGIEMFIEIGPAHTLTSIGKKCYPQLRWIGSETAVR